MKDFFKSNVFYWIAVGVFLLGVVLCATYQIAKDKPSTVTETVVKTDSLTNSSVDVTKITDLDKQYMYVISNEYAWFETSVKLTGTVDTLTTPSIESIENVFQVTTPTDDGFKTSVYFMYHTLTGSEREVKEDAFWLEDKNMILINDKFLDFSEVYQRLQESNCVKPNSQYATLRQQIGPNDVNPQWIFGNDNRGMVFVDAITGTVSTENPVFK